MENKKKSKIEGILFAAGEPVNVSKLAKFLKMKSSDFNKEVDALAQDYRQHGHGLQIIHSRNTIQLASSSEVGESVANFLKKNLNEPLSNAALEVLSVIAYRGPVTRAQVEHIRGVNCSFTIRNLAIRGLVERKDNPADNRSYLYEASGDFIKSLGLNNLKELPEFEALHVKENVEKTIKDEKQSDE